MKKALFFLLAAIVQAVLPCSAQGTPPSSLTQQFNAFAGYRFNRNLCELSAGLLNLTDQNYQLSPLNPYSDIARERTFVLRFRLNF